MRALFSGCLAAWFMFCLHVAIPGASQSWSGLTPCEITRLDSSFPRARFSVLPSGTIEFSLPDGRVLRNAFPGDVVLRDAADVRWGTVSVSAPNFPDTRVLEYTLAITGPSSNAADVKTPTRVRIRVRLCPDKSNADSGDSSAGGGRGKPVVPPPGPPGKPGGAGGANAGGPPAPGPPSSTKPNPGQASGTAEPGLSIPTPPAGPAPTTPLPGPAPTTPLPGPAPTTPLPGPAPTTPLPGPAPTTPLPGPAPTSNTPFPGPAPDWAMLLGWVDGLKNIVNTVEKDWTQLSDEELSELLHKALGDFPIGSGAPPLGTPLAAGDQQMIVDGASGLTNTNSLLLPRQSPFAIARVLFGRWFQRGGHGQGAAAGRENMIAATDSRRERTFERSESAAQVTDRVLRASLVSTGGSTGDVFEFQVVTESGRPVPFVFSGLVVQPLAPSAVRQPAVARGRTQTVKVAGYCLDFAKNPPTAGTVFALAPPQVQGKYAMQRHVLRAARDLAAQGRLHPDSNVKSYVESIKQYAIWTRIEGWSEATFAGKFLERTKKNFSELKQRWTKEIETAVRAAAPGRWRDISAVLAEAGRLGGATAR